MQKEFSFYKIFSEFFILGLYSFGGPTAHIGFFQEKFVKRKKWLSEKKFMEFVSLSQFLPGPSSSQVGFLIGLQKGSYWGGLAAWLGFTIPSAFLMILSALIVVSYTNTNGMNEAVKFLNGFASVAIPIIAVALINMGKNFCYENDFIISAIDENHGNDKITINFTPIKVSEIIENDSLFPPKSTWITPRI